MRVRVLVFGVLKDRLGAAESELDLPAESRVSDVLLWLADRLPGEPLLHSLAAAVNREYATAGTVLHEADEVALLPPVSGGSPIRCGLGRPHV